MVDMDKLKKDAVKGVERVAEKLDMKVLMPVPARVRDRMAELKTMSSAKTVKIMRGNIKTFQTTAPKMFISNLSSRIINGVGSISYGVYKMDGANKYADEEKETIINSKGEKVERTVNIHYMIEKTVVETIEYHKTIKKEEYREELVL